MLKVGLLGAGRIGKVHAKAVSAGTNGAGAAGGTAGGSGAITMCGAV